jgi:hypothetical protein
MSVIVFNRPDCEKCNELAPTFEQLAEKLSKLPEPIRIAKADGKVHYKIAGGLRIKEFPVLVMYAQAHHKVYAGDVSNVEGRIS